MQLFANLFANELVSSIRSTDDIVELYEKGFGTQNAMVAICAQNELVRRGELNRLSQTLISCVDEGQLKLGTEFAHLIAISLSELGGFDPMLEKIGDYLYLNADKTKVITLEEIESLIQLPKVVSIDLKRKKGTIGIENKDDGKLKLFM